jgi:hypothetical protein
MSKKQEPIDVLTGVAKIILSIKTAIGFILIGIGIYCAVKIIFLVIQLFTNPQQIPFFPFTEGLSQKTLQMFITSTGGLGVSEVVFYYGVAIILLLFIGGLTKRILKLGILLINRLELKYIMERIFEEWQKNKQQFTDTEDEELDKPFFMRNRKTDFK